MSQMGLFFATGSAAFQFTSTFSTYSAVHATPLAMSRAWDPLVILLLSSHRTAVKWGRYSGPPFQVGFSLFFSGYIFYGTPIQVL